MLHLPTMAGPDALRLLVEDLPRGQALQLLGVTDRTLRRWLASGGRPPAAAFAALYWHTRWGESEILSRYGFAHDLVHRLEKLRTPAPPQEQTPARGRGLVSGGRPGQRFLRFRNRPLVSRGVVFLRRMVRPFVVMAETQPGMISRM